MQRRHRGSCDCQKQSRPFANVLTTGTVAQENGISHRFGNHCRRRLRLSIPIQRRLASCPYCCRRPRISHQSLYTGYGITVGLNAAFNSDVLKETAVADSRHWFYSNRELPVRAYDYAEDGSRALLYSVDAQAEAAQNETYDTKLPPLRP